MLLREECNQSMKTPCCWEVKVLDLGVILAPCSICVVTSTHQSSQSSGYKGIKETQNPQKEFLMLSSLSLSFFFFSFFFSSILLQHCTPVTIVADRYFYPELILATLRE